MSGEELKELGFIELVKTCIDIEGPQCEAARQVFTQRYVEVITEELATGVQSKLEAEDNTKIENIPQERIQSLIDELIFEFLYRTFRGQFPSFIDAKMMTDPMAHFGLIRIACTWTIQQFERRLNLSPDPQIALNQSAETISLAGYILQVKEDVILKDMADQTILLPEPSIEIVDNWREIIKAIDREPENLYNLDWKEFEKLIAYLLEKAGWSVQLMGHTKDDGIDIICITRVEPDFKFNMMVQCKRYAKDRKVQVKHVREVWATKSKHSFHQALIATTTTFTTGATTQADEWNLDLRDHNAILEWCRQYGTIKL